MADPGFAFTAQFFPLSGCPTVAPLSRLPGRRPASRSRCCGSPVRAHWRPRYQLRTLPLPIALLPDLERAFDRLHQRPDQLRPRCAGSGPPRRSRYRRAHSSSCAVRAGSPGLLQLVDQGEHPLVLGLLLLLGHLHQPVAVAGDEVGTGFEGASWQARHGLIPFGIAEIVVELLGSVIGTRSPFAVSDPRAIGFGVLVGSGLPFVFESLEAGTASA